MVHDDKRESRRRTRGVVQREQDGLTPITPAGRGCRARGRHWARWGLSLVASMSALAVILGLKFAVCDSREVECTTEARDVDSRDLEAACALEYTKTGDPRVGLAYARALYRTGRNDAAAGLASSLLVSWVRSDALHLLGRIAHRRGRYDHARSALERARELHRAEKNLAAVASDEQALATVLVEEKKYAEVLRMLDHCIADARSSGARLIEGYCRLSASQTLAEVGLIQGARHELERADPLLEGDRDRAALYIERGNLHQHTGDNAQAVFEFRRALPAAGRAQLVDMVLRIHLNLAYSLAETERTQEAAEHLETARTIDHEDAKRPERLHLAGRIAYRQGRLSLAAPLLEEAYRAANEDDERLEIAVLRARIAVADGDRDAAARWAKLGVKRAEEVRRAQTALELRPWVLSSRRSAYELLFSVLARSGETEEALVVFDRWYGRTLLDALSRPSDKAEPIKLEDAAFQTETLHELIPSLSSAPLMVGEEAETVLESSSSAELLALVAAEGEAWRVVATGGSMEVDSLGPLDALRPLLRSFAAEPTDAAAADELGAALLPAVLVRETQEALRVVLDGPFAALPIAALRHRGRPLVAVRPVIRPPRLSAVRCVPPLPEPRRALVLADAEGDLPDARREARRVANLFGTEALVGQAATRAALFSTRPLDILHIATHATLGASGGLLRLHDGNISALEVSAKRLAASRVVLAACVSALPVDEEGATSLATAFLSGGATQVVATVRPVSDKGSEELTRYFYAAGGAIDPVRGLARAQRDLANTPNSDWPHFVVFGRDTCSATR